MTTMTAQKQHAISIYDYLQIYLGNANWEEHLNRLHSQLNKRNKGSELNNQVACAMMMAYMEKYKLTTPPESLIFQVGSWTQIKDRDWYSDFSKVRDQDDEYEMIKDDLLSYGVIEPLEFYPVTRQAYNWLVERAKLSDDGCSPETAQKLKNLVYVYGGAVICNVFEKPEWQKKIKDLHNWRTGYFFRRLIHEVYPDVNDIKKIKHMEIKRLQQADSKLVRAIKKD